MNRRKIRKAAIFSLILLAFLICIIYLEKMPKIIPIHYDIHGKVDSYGSRNNIFILPIYMIAFTVFIKIILHFVKKSDTYNGEEEFIDLINILILIVFNLLNCCTVYTSYNNITDLNSKAIRIDCLMISIVGLIYIGIGFIILKCKAQKNTSKDKYKEIKIRKFSGKIFIITGLIITLSCILIAKPLINIAIIIISTMISIILVLKYSITHS